MPWEIISNVLLEVAASKAVKGGYRLFQDHALPWITTKLARTYAERYLLLKSSQLCEFYNSETPLTYNYGKLYFRLPLSLLIPPTTNRLPTEEKIRVKTSSHNFTVPRQISDYTRPLLEYLRSSKDSRLFNGQVASLRSISSNDSGDWELVLAAGSYFEALATNFAMDHRPNNREQSLREFISRRTGRLGDLEESPLVNHLGVVCMVESLDGKLVVQERSHMVANRPNSLSSSVSGALDWSDIGARSEWTIEGISLGVLRESLEELGVKSESVWFLGLIREYLRGGKPEAYFYAKSDCTFDEIEAERKTAKDRRESKNLVPYEIHTELLDGSPKEIIAYHERVVRVLEKIGPRANLTLIAGVCLLSNRLLNMVQTKK
jgi:hypothetical protein